MRAKAELKRLQAEASIWSSESELSPKFWLQSGSG